MKMNVYVSCCFLNVLYNGFFENENNGDIGIRSMAEMLLIQIYRTVHARARAVLILAFKNYDVPGTSMMFPNKARFSITLA